MNDVVQRALEGDVDAQLDLARAYSQGFSALHESWDPREATLSLYWYRKAAEQGCAEAQYELAKAYDEGAGIPLNRAQSLYWLEKAARNGIYYAQADLSRRFMLGDGAPQDNRMAFKWLAESVENADCTGGLAYSHFGAMTANGIGTSSDHSEAAVWFKRAAESGDVTGMLFFAEALESGRGVEQDLVEARKWFRRAGNNAFESPLAELFIKQGKELPGFLDQQRTAAGRFSAYEEQADKGWIDKCLNLAFIYARGDLVERDLEKAISYFRKLAEFKNHVPLAFLKLGQLLEASDSLESIYWYYRAASSEYPEAQFKIASELEDGWLLPVMLDEAKHWYLLAAKHGHQVSMERDVAFAGSQGDPIAAEEVRGASIRSNAESGSPQAMAVLGLMRLLGIGGSEDLVRSYQWFNLGAALGDQACREWRDRVGKMTSERQIEIAQAGSVERYEELVARWIEQGEGHHFEVGSITAATPTEAGGPSESESYDEHETTPSWPFVSPLVSKALLEVLGNAVGGAVDDLFQGFDEIGMQLPSPYRCRCGFFAPITCGLLNILIAGDEDCRGPFRLVTGRASALVCEDPEEWFEFRCSHPLWNEDEFHMWCAAATNEVEDVIVDFSPADWCRLIPAETWKRASSTPEFVYSPQDTESRDVVYRPERDFGHIHFQDVADDLLGTMFGQGVAYALLALDKQGVDEDDVRNEILSLR